MNTNENPKGIWTPVWPDRRAVLLRLLLITSVVFPLSWAVNALLVGSWNLLGDRNAESVRHLIEWQVIWIATVVVVFLASLLPPLHWLVSRFNARRWSLGLVCMATLVVLFYAEENWRGARAWNQYRQQLEASGAQLDLETFVPMPVSDEQNFAAIPFIKGWFEMRGRSDRIWADDYLTASAMVSSSSTNKARRQFLDLVAWEMAFAAVSSAQTNEGGDFASDKLELASRAKAAPRVLQGLKTSEPYLNELRAASRRPHARYPVIYDLDDPWGILLPHLVVVRSVCQRLQLKACAELAAGQGERALEDVDLMLRMADSLKGESFLISYLVRIACLQLAIQPIWEGLAEHRWTEAQLQDLQTRLDQYNFLADFKRPLDGERAAGILTAELLFRKKVRLSDLFDQADSMGGTFVNLIGRVVPRGWYYQEQLNYTRLFQQQLEGTFDATRKRVSPAQIASNAHELEREIAGSKFGKGFGGLVHHRLLATMLLPALGKLPLKAATAQTAADQAALACALERYRLANGQFPEKLESLVPRFIPQLPNDLPTGEPYKYRRTDDGQFVLYSFGWNEKDDGGVPGKTLFDEKQGDWVWSYPAK